MGRAIYVSNWCCPSLSVTYCNCLQTHAWNESWMTQYLALCPKFHTPVSTAADKEIALKRAPLHPIHWTQVSTVCLQILFRVGCAAFVYVAILCASYVHALITPAEIKRHATASAANEGLALDVTHGCCSCWTNLLLRYRPFQLDQVCVLKALHELDMSFFQLPLMINLSAYNTAGIWCQAEYHSWLLYARR